MSCRLESAACVTLVLLTVAASLGGFDAASRPGPAAPAGNVMPASFDAPGAEHMPDRAGGAADAAWADAERALQAIAADVHELNAWIVEQPPAVRDRWINWLTLFETRRAIAIERLDAVKFVAQDADDWTIGMLRDGLGSDVRSLRIDLRRAFARSGIRK